jgi:hypothetical protein
MRFHTENTQFLASRGRALTRTLFDTYTLPFALDERNMGYPDYREVIIKE